MMKICVSIVELDVEAAAQAATKAAERGADLVEVRFDLMPSLPKDLSAFKRIPIPKIATLRATPQGGRFAGNESTRMGFYQQALRSGFDMVDLELGSPVVERRGMELRDAGVICSYHDLGATPPAMDILDILVKASSMDALPKAAFTINSCQDLLTIVDAAHLFSSTEKEFVLIGMGELGELTRVGADQLGCAFTFASLEPGKEAAPGQVDVATLRRLTPDRKVVGIIGDPISHSLSPQMHNAAFLETRVPGIYLKFQVKSAELEDFFQVAVEYDLRGFNITIPHKEAVRPLLDRLSPTADQVGAVNTVLIEEGEFIGHNTDLHGVEMTFKENAIEPKGKKALVVGAGGAARACCAYLAGAGAKVSVYNRTRARAEELARSFRNCRAIDLDSLSVDGFDIVINCTPVGMKGFSKEAPIPVQVLRAGQFVVDVVYNPPRTDLLLEAEKVGAVIANGERMLVHQARKSFEIWTGKIPSYEVMAQALREVPG